MEVPRCAVRDGGEQAGYWPAGRAKTLLEHSLAQQSPPHLYNMQGSLIPGNSGDSEQEMLSF